MNSGIVKPHPREYWDCWTTLTWVVILLNHAHVNSEIAKPRSRE